MYFSKPPGSVCSLSRELVTLSFLGVLCHGQLWKQDSNSRKKVLRNWYTGNICTGEEDSLVVFSLMPFFHSGIYFVSLTVKTRIPSPLL